MNVRNEAIIRYDGHAYSHRQIWRLLRAMARGGWHITLGVRSGHGDHWQAMAQRGTSIYGPYAARSPWSACRMLMREVQSSEALNGGGG